MLAVVTCYFNPIEQDKILENYLKFREQFNENLFTIELSFNGEYAISDSHHVRGNVVMWHKERLLNLMIQNLPEEYDKVAWVDADIIFSNPDWIQETEKALEKYNIVQLFEYADSLPGVVHACSDDPFEEEPGKAWASHRKLLESNGLLDKFIMGGSEHMMFYALKGMFKNPMMNRLNIEWRHSYLKWAAPFYRSMQNSVSCIPGNISHLDHGSYADPDFSERWMILSHNRFDPEIDITCKKTGSWQWSSNKKNLHRQVAEYFEERKEDEQWIANLRSS